MTGPSERKPFLRRALPFLAILVFAAALYDGFVFYSRWKSNTDAKREREKAEVERDRKTVEMLGGDTLKILAFYASPPSIQAGRSTLICFGVNAAKTVRIEPPVEDLHPAPSRCFPVSPSRDTEYKLIAEDAAGHSAAQTLVVHVSR
ncbi:MAG TPA: hypothetical protein VKX49_06025 [Bryobacteraceae bacterium]|nr:hypothetical protein [Bryobacteraceae bacterium]